jgi:hypothetical protein
VLGVALFGSLVGQADAFMAAACGADHLGELSACGGGNLARRFKPGVTLIGEA